MRLRVATFNIENLTSRSRVGPRPRPDTAPALSLFDAPTPEAREAVQRAIAISQEDDKRQATALAIAEADADILLLQEVDNLGVLEAFFANYVHAVTRRRYSHVRLVNGNDPKGIDVAFAACDSLLDGPDRITVISHREATFGEFGIHEDDLARFGINAESRVFNRDCLEVRLDLTECDITLYLCHFKSISEGIDDARSVTSPLRRSEVRAVRKIIERRFGEHTPEAFWVIGGDFNDFRERVLAGGAEEPAVPSSIDALFGGFAYNPVDALVPHQRWTYFSDSAGGSGSGEHVQLDYLLLSPALARHNPSPAVEIIRAGLPYRVPLDPRSPDRSIGYLSSRGGRYPRIGWDRPKASDHCPLVVEIAIPPRA